MNVNKSIQVFSKVGHELAKLSENLDASQYSDLIKGALAQNGWFTKDTVKHAFKALAAALAEDKIGQWLCNYPIHTKNSQKTIGIIMAGNIPLVGFHDLLCTLISGNKVLAKLSSKDQLLYDVIKDILVRIDGSFESRINFAEGPLKNIDAIIATGSDNSARYFEYYFNKYPHIIRKNRNSICIISGNESFEELQNLGDDIFTYFGLGCRNVSFLMVPENYQFDGFFQAIEKFNFIGHHNKYANNYEYQKAIMMMNKVPMYDNGFVLLKNETSISSPIGVIHYMFYKSKEEVDIFMEVNKHKIQCIVSKTNWPFNTYGLGMAQQPELWDYADNIDTLSFLLNLK